MYQFFQNLGDFLKDGNHQIKYILCATDKTDENVDLLKDKDNGSLSIAPIKDEKRTTVFCIIVRPDLISVRINQVFLL